MRPIDFELIFRQAPTAFSVVDLHGHQIDGSDHYWDLFGIDPDSDDAHDAVISRLTDDDDAELTRQYFERLTAGTIEAITVEKRYRRVNGERFWGRLRSNPVRNEDGEVVAIAGVITDISAEREARAALVASEVERTRADQRVVADAIRHFVAGVEHQVRTPLHSILGLTELLAGGADLTVSQRSALHDEVLRLLSIVEEVSEFSNAEAGSGTETPARRRLDARWSASLDSVTAEHGRRATVAHESSRGTRVLVVDDGEVNRLLAVSQLERLGYATATASNGLEAVDMAAAQHFDAILMDWHMPVLDGVDAARRIRASEVIGRRVPIIAITAAVVGGHRATCLDAGMDEVLIKPVDIATLDAALRRHLRDAPTNELGPERARAAADVNAPPSSSIDRRALEELERETGDRSVVGVIIDTYLDELQPRLELIGATAEVVRSGEQKATRELMRSAHTLKSTSALVGATRLSRLCEQLQQLTSDRASVEAIGVAEELIAEARRSALDLQTVRNQL